MRRLSFLNKVVYATNILFALLLFLACLSPYIATKTLSFLPFLGLSVPALVLINLLYFGYWLLKRKRQFKISFLVLIIGYLSLGTFIRFWGTDEKTTQEDLTILSYNVREFNRNENLASKTVFEDIKTLIEKEDPDIFSIQESGNRYRTKAFNYPYKYVTNKRDEIKTKLSIFSKYPILDAQLIYFPKTKNNACYADIVIKKDTIRVYNVHMQSLGITPGMGTIRSNSSQKLYSKLTAKFIKQEEQANILADHYKKSPFKNIITGDFNNNQYSRTYNLIKGDKIDSFDKRGFGYDRTFIFHGLPVRIDFILVDPNLEITSHKNFDQKYSDHFPIMASLRLASD